MSKKRYFLVISAQACISAAGQACSVIHMVGSMDSQGVIVSLRLAASSEYLIL